MSIPDDDVQDADLERETLASQTTLGDVQNKSSINTTTTDNSGKFTNPSPFESFLRFSIEVVGATAIFFVVAGAAVLISKSVHYLDGMGIDGGIKYGLTFIEYLVFGVDLLLYCRYLYLSVKRNWGKL